MVPSVEIKIGAYVEVSEESARGRYSFDRPLLALAGENDLIASEMLESVVLQLIIALRPYATKVVLYDESVGRQFEGVRQLIASTAESQKPIGEQWINSREALNRLRALDELMQRRVALLAATQQPTIYAYNQDRRAPELVWLVVLANLPSLIAQDAEILHTLRRLVEHGPVLGVVPVLLHDVHATSQRGLASQQSKMLYGFLSDWGPRCMGFNFYREIHVPFGVGEPYQRFLRDFGYIPNLPVEQRQAWVQLILKARADYERADPRQDFLSVRMGESMARTAYFGLGHATRAFHALISGGSGSGKTTFVQNVILSICEQYAPEQIQLILVDYGTVSFAPYRDIAHVLTVYDQPTDGEKMGRLLYWITHELHRRKELFRICGIAHNVTVDNLDTYTRLSGDILPALVIVIDEFGSLMSRGNNKTCKNGQGVVHVKALAEDTVNLLAREGRKVGMHAVLITQSFAKVDLMPQDIKSNPHAAIGLKAEQPQDSRALLNSENDAAYHIAAFQAIRNTQGGVVRGNVVVDLDYVTEQEISRRQETLRQRWPKHGRSVVENFLQEEFAIEHKPVTQAPSWLRPVSSIGVGS